MTEHVHRFIIAPPEGATSLGRCKCGERREFYNSLEAERGSGHWKQTNTYAKKRKMTTAESKAHQKSMAASKGDLTAATAALAAGQ